MENQTCRIKPADRLASVSEYYFSKKLKEVAQMNAEGMDVISLGIGSPDMPPSEKTIRTLCEAACNPDGHGYMPYVGIPELRRGFADWYQKWYGVALTIIASAFFDLEKNPMLFSNKAMSCSN